MRGLFRRHGARGAAAFTVKDNWHGGFYELSLELGEGEDRLDRAMQMLGRAVKVDGCHARRDREPRRRNRVPCAPTSFDGADSGHLYGRVRLPDRSLVVCGFSVMREEDWSNSWLNFYVPMGALACADPRVGSFPFGEDGGPRSLAWRTPIDLWLADVGTRVYPAAEYRLGLIGHEAFMAVDASELSGDPPRQREFGYLLPGTDGTVRYLPAEH